MPVHIPEPVTKGNCQYGAEYFNVMMPVKVQPIDTSNSTTEVTLIICKAPSMSTLPTSFINSSITYMSIASKKYDHTIPAVYNNSI